MSQPLTAGEILEMANRGEAIPADRALATYADPANWVQLYDGQGFSGYTPKACEWAFIGPMRPGYELAQHAAKSPQENRCGPGHTPNTKLSPLGPQPRRKMLIEIEASEDFEKRLDNQWMVEREIHADRWAWAWGEIAREHYTCWICKEQKQGKPAYETESLAGPFRYCERCWNKHNEGAEYPPRTPQGPIDDNPPFGATEPMPPGGGMTP